MAQQTTNATATVGASESKRVFARVLSGTIVELLNSAVDPGKLFHPALHWIDVTGQAVRVGWVHSASGFAPPAVAESTVAKVPTIGELQAELNLLAARIAALHGAATH